MQVRFGADAVFKAEQGADPTDEDIEALLARGEKRSKEDSERLKASVNSLASFTLGGEEKSLYEYEGQDWKKKGKDEQAWAISLPKRVTKQNYDENEYYRNAIHGKVDARGAPKPPRQLATLDFQFFDLEKLRPLHEAEVRNYEYRKAHYDRRTQPDAAPLDEAEMERVAPPLSKQPPVPSPECPSVLPSVLLSVLPSVLLYATDVYVASLADRPAERPLPPPPFAASC